MRLESVCSSSQTRLPNRPLRGLVMSGRTRSNLWDYVTEDHPVHSKVLGRNHQAGAPGWARETRPALQ